MRGYRIGGSGASRGTRTVLLAFGGGLAAAVFVMFLPSANLENLTGHTGVAEVIPAAHAPLGGFARALIAYGTGIAVTALLALLITQAGATVQRTGPFSYYDKALPKDAPQVSRPAAHSVSPRYAERRSRGRVPDWMMKAARRARGDTEDAIFDLSDLPKLRAADRHPDAPARRPIVASADLGAPLDAPMSAASSTPTAEPDAPRPIAAQPPMAAEPARTVRSPRPARPSAATIAAMVSRAARPEELRSTETVADLLARLERSIARNSMMAATPGRIAARAPSAPPRPAANQPGHVPMDDALRSALKSLGRMSAAR